MASTPGLVSGWLCWYYGLHIHIQSGAGDFTWILHAAEDLLAGRDPYSNRSLGAPAPVELIVPVMVLARTNVTQVIE